VSSPPVAALVGHLLTTSDNDLAESLGRLVAVAAGEPASFAGAATAVTDAVRSLGLGMRGVRLYDASGLSRLDRVTPRVLVGLLRLAIDRPDLSPLFTGLPVAGLTGTLAERMDASASRPAAGVGRAKTGTLAGVSALAGQVVDVDGSLLLFAFLTDRAALPQPTEQALDALVGRLARCGCG
jgi:D-alanyl-D-alanine carboxypeptidase/D-alanyl-D-alanine-endopeptidase (penicillin-binding protein 4)